MERRQPTQEVVTEKEDVTDTESQLATISLARVAAETKRTAPPYETPTVVDGGDLADVTLGPCTEGWGDATYGWRNG